MRGHRTEGLDLFAWRLQEEYQLHKQRQVSLQRGARRDAQVRDRTKTLVGNHTARLAHEPHLGPVNCTDVPASRRVGSNATLAAAETPASAHRIGLYPPSAS